MKEQQHADSPADLADILSERIAAESIKRSFDILRNTEPRLNKYVRRRRRCKPAFFPGVGTKELTQEEKDSLTAFANKYILGKRAEREEERRGEEERCAKRRRGENVATATAAATISGDSADPVCITQTARQA